MSEYLFTEIGKYVQEKWESWALPGPSPTRFSFIRRSSTWLNQAGKVVYYIFRRGDRYPTLMAKTMFTATHGDAIQQEASNSFHVWEYLSSIIPPTMPQPIALTEISGLPVYFEKAVPGETLADRGWRRWTIKGRTQLLETAIDQSLAWLDQFTHKMPMSSFKLDEKAIHTLFLNPILKFKDREKFWSDDLIRLDQLIQSVIEWEGHAFPLVASHGDLWGGSLLYSKQGLCVIDWEFFRKYALPTDDLFMMATHPGFCIAPTQEDGLLGEFQNLSSNTNTADAINERLLAYMDSWGIPRQWYTSLLHVFLIQKSVERDALMKDSVEGKWGNLLRYAWELAN